MKNNKYNELIKYQGKQLHEIDIHTIMDAVIEAGRNEDYDNLPIELKNNEDRYVTFLSFDYQNEDAEEMIVSTPFNTYHLPAVTTSNEINYRAVENRIKNTLKDYSEIETYIDMNYLLNHDDKIDLFQNSSENLDLESNEMDYIGTTILEELTNEDKEVKMEPEILKKNRTKIESDYEINLNDIASELRKIGYFVKSKPGGSLLVTDENLSSENSITITKKNAYIETAELKTLETKALFDKMREKVVAKMIQSLDSTKEKYELMKTAPRLAEISTQSIIREMMTIINTDRLTAKPDYGDDFACPKRKYSFKDQDGNDYMQISLVYHIKDNSQSDSNHDAIPMLVAKYGPKYGDVTKSFEVSLEDMKAFKQDQLYKSDLINQINAFVSIGTKDRDSIYRELKYEKNDQVIDEIFKKEFKNLNTEKSDFFANITKRYYRTNEREPFTDYMLNNLKNASFFRESMLNDFGNDAFIKMFQDLEKKITITDLSDLKLNKISQNCLSYTIEEFGKIEYDNKIKDPVEYDREWVTKLARMQDKLIELRNGPVQSILETTQNIIKGVNEARKGIVSVYKDGMYSGLEFGNGIGSIREGLNYGHVLYNLENEYKNLIQSEKTEDQIAAINKKIDIKLYRDDIIRNANIYVKSAVIIRDKVDNMIELIGAAKLSAQVNLKSKGHTFMTSSGIKLMEDNFKKLSAGIVSSFKELGYSFGEMGKGVMMIGSGTLGFSKDSLSFANNKSLIALNDFKRSYNDVVKDAKLVLNSKEFSKDFIAEKLNDFRIEQSFYGIQSDEFYKVMETRFWCELDKTIANGKLAEQLDLEDRTDVDMDYIQHGKQAILQKEQNLFIADRLNTQIKTSVIKDNQITLDDAVELLAIEYHQSAMSFNVMNGASSMKSYQDLNDSEKNMCKNIITQMLNEMPNVSEKLIQNQEKSERTTENFEKITISKECKSER